jgi:hypothetical protein
LEEHQVEKMHSIKKIFSIVPFLVASVVISFNWYVLIVEGYFLTSKHIFALVLIVLNLMVYFWRYKLALLLTGVILFLSTFDLISFTVTVTRNSYFVRIGSLKISTPSVNLISLFLLALFVIGNFGLLKSCFKKLLD